MSSKIFLGLLSLSFAGVACGGGMSANRVAATELEPERTVCVHPDAERATFAQPAVAEMQPSQTDAKVSAPQASVDTESAAVAPEFPDRQSVEALDRLARTVPVDVGKHQATITLPSDDYFDAGSAKLNDSARWRLDDIARALASQSGRTIAIRVYTDALGDGAESARLSQERAVALGDYFLAQGVSANSLRAEGMGPEHPVADNATAAGRASNRRIEITIEASHDSCDGRSNREGAADGLSSPAHCEHVSVTGGRRRASDSGSLRGRCEPTEGHHERKGIQ